MKEIDRFHSVLERAFKDGQSARVSNEARNLKMPDDPEGWLRDLEKRLHAAQKKLPSGAKDKYRKLMCELIELMRVQIGEARGAIARQDEASLRVSVLYLVKNWTRLRFNADRKTALDLREVNSGKGDMGAAARWGDRDEFKKVMKTLAAMTDDWDSGPLSIHDLWGRLYNMLDEDRQRPNDTSGETIRDDDRMTWTGRPDGITYKTFGNTISACRTAMKKK